MALLLMTFLLPGTLRADTKLEQFFAQNCVQCHCAKEQNGEVRLDKPVDTLLADAELLEKITTLIESGEMPPEEAPQPSAEAVAAITQLLQKRILAQRPTNPLKRLTRAEYTNTIRDLFGVDFDFDGLLPPDHVEQGFDKFGEAHLMSPHQVMAYLKTARFVAERLLPDTKPETQTWEFDARHFHGSKNFATGGGGDYRDGDRIQLPHEGPAFNEPKSKMHLNNWIDLIIEYKKGTIRISVNGHSKTYAHEKVTIINEKDKNGPRFTFKGGEGCRIVFDSVRLWKCEE